LSLRFDLVVLGTGSAGVPVATKCRAAGWEVAIVDSRPYGGTCALRGCDPKKVLVGVTHALDEAQRLGGRGLGSDSLRIDWPALMAFKRGFVEPVPRRRERALESSGARLFHGAARFVGPTAVQVGEEVLEARHVHIATGAEPAPLEIPGREHLIDSEAFLELERLPETLVFVGGGYIAFELAHVAARAGARVTILHRSARPLAGFDPDLVDMLVERTRSLGVDVRLGAEVASVERRGEGLRAIAATSAGREGFDAGAVVHAAGRVPALRALDLERAGVEWGPAGVKVDPYLRSVSNAAVSAAGDAADSGPPLTPVASFDAHVAATNLLHGPTRAVSYPPVPSVVFTSPLLASVGMQAEEARHQGLGVEVRHQRTDRWYSARRLAEPCAGFKVVLEKETGRILGAHLLGPGADEVINLFALAMRGGMTARDLKQTIFAYPTVGSDLPYML